MNLPVSNLLLHTQTLTAARTSDFDQLEALMLFVIHSVSTSTTQENAPPSTGTATCPLIMPTATPPGATECGQSFIAA